MSSSLARRYLLRTRLFHERLAQLRGEEPNVRSHPAVGTDFDDLDPAQCTLLVLDCQPEGLACVVNSHSLIVRINSAIGTVRRLGGQVAFTRLAFEDNDYRFTPSTNKEFAALAHERRLRDGTFDADLYPGLDAGAPEDIIVRKTRLGAFSTTNLDERLTNLGMTTLIIAGIHASGAVMSTIREAADKDYRLIVLADCISDADAATQQLLMEWVFPRQAKVLAVSQLERALASHAVAGDITTAAI
ncbi:cysteine hydrolase [Mycobacterium sp. CVI_P3]|uniref:Cysteine hydrolase n=2 Tax=Mycobacterium pinniadriaticum TaxID=2994102 RepID=A0ABT3SCP9_9MYCO|nr:cysteine hydrolase [Mycobacterium pinniadriaticum]MCX2937268.1 cysteine hydrolase [Mycobacterium pinniadriaticum]